jgi:hypothetical protein
LAEKAFWSYIRLPLSGATAIGSFLRRDERGANVGDGLALLPELGVTAHLPLHLNVVEPDAVLLRSLLDGYFVKTLERYVAKYGMAQLPARCAGPWMCRCRRWRPDHHRYAIASVTSVQCLEVRGVEFEAAFVEWIHRQAIPCR